MGDSGNAVGSSERHVVLLGLQAAQDADHFDGGLRGFGAAIVIAAQAPNTRLSSRFRAPTPRESWHAGLDLELDQRLSQPLRCAQRGWFHRAARRPDTPRPRDEARAPAKPSGHDGNLEGTSTRTTSI